MKTNTILDALRHRQHMNDVRNKTMYMKRYYEENKQLWIEDRDRAYKEELADADEYEISSAQGAFSGRISEYDTLSAAAEAQERLAETEYLVRIARDYFLATPDRKDEEMWTYVPILTMETGEGMEGRHRTELYNQKECLTLKGIGVLRAVIRKERKERLDFFQVHIALALSGIAAVFGFMSFIVAHLK